MVKKKGAEDFPQRRFNNQRVSHHHISIFFPSLPAPGTDGEEAEEQRNHGLGHTAGFVIGRTIHNNSNGRSRREAVAVYSRNGTEEGKALKPWRSREKPSWSWENMGRIIRRTRLRISKDLSNLSNSLGTR